jgi:hypothetical protein
MACARFPVQLGAAGILFSLLTCRPVFAIGWSEIVILFLLVAFLLGPILLKLARAWIAYQEPLKKKRD